MYFFNCTDINTDVHQTKKYIGIIKIVQSSVPIFKCFINILLWVLNFLAGFWGGLKYENVQRTRLPTSYFGLGTKLNPGPYIYLIYIEVIYLYESRASRMPILQYHEFFRPPSWGPCREPYTHICYLLLNVIIRLIHIKIIKDTTKVDSQHEFHM